MRALFHELGLIEVESVIASGNLTFCAPVRSAAVLKAILACRSTQDDFRVEGREVYWHCLTKQSESPFFKVPFEKRIGAAATWRGVNTLRRLAAKYAGEPG